MNQVFLFKISPLLESWFSPKSFLPWKVSKGFTVAFIMFYGGRFRAGNTLLLGKLTEEETTIQKWTVSPLWAVKWVLLKKEVILKILFIHFMIDYRTVKNTKASLIDWLPLLRKQLFYLLFQYQHLFQ